MEGVTYNFGGTHTLTVDDKGRLTVPSSFRRELGEDVVVRKNMRDRCVEILPPAVWDLYLGQLQTLPKIDDMAQLFVTLETAGAVTTTIDRQGRLLIPADQKELAGIEGGQVVVTGAIDRVKVWSAERWAEVQERARKEDLAAYVYANFKANFTN